MMRTYPAAYPVYWAASENLWPAIYQLTEGDVQPSISSEAKLNFDTKFKAFWQVLEAGTHLDDRWFTLGYLTGLFPFEKRIEQYILPRIYHLYEYLLKKGADPNKCTSIWNLPLDQACEGNHERLISILLAHGAVNPRGIVRRYVRDWGEASNPSRQSVMELLLDQKFDQKNNPAYAPRDGWYKLEPEDYNWGHYKWELPSWAQDL